MSAGDPVFKAYAVYALHVGLFSLMSTAPADMAPTSNSATVISLMQQLSILTRWVKKGLLVRLPVLSKFPRMAFSVILECFTSTDSAIFVEIITLI